MSIDTKEADQSLENAEKQLRQALGVKDRLIAQLYPEQQENGQVLKSMKFKFPVFYKGQSIEEIRWDKENTVESIALLSNRKMRGQ